MFPQSLLFFVLWIKMSLWSQLIYFSVLNDLVDVKGHVDFWKL